MLHTFVHFEVDSTESVWYSSAYRGDTIIIILKLTPQSQYGIASIDLSDTGW